MNQYETNVIGEATSLTRDDDFTIRRATLDEAADIARLLTPLGYPTPAKTVIDMWDRWSAEGNIALVAALDGDIVGFVTLHTMLVFHRPRPVGRITSLAVDDAARGRGIGRALVRAAEHELARAGCGMIEVTSHMRRKDAHAFYLHLGYEQTSYRFATIVNEDAT
jgi:GNAT superfamily N-acetyltransferase